MIKTKNFSVFAEICLRNRPPGDHQSQASGHQVPVFPLQVTANSNQLLD